MKQPVFPALLASVSLVLVACGGSDAPGDDSDAAGEDANEQSDAGSDEPTATAGGLDGAREAPCDVIPVSVVDDALGGSFETATDEFSETICQYTGEDMNFAIAWGPGFGGSVRSNFDRSEGDGVEINGLGDFAYRYQNLELAFELDGDAISIQGGLDMETQGVALAKAIIAQLS